MLGNVIFEVMQKMDIFVSVIKILFLVAKANISVLLEASKITLFDV